MKITAVNTGTITAVTELLIISSRWGFAEVTVETVSPRRLIIIFITIFDTGPEKTRARGKESVATIEIHISLMADFPIPLWYPT